MTTAVTTSTQAPWQDRFLRAVSRRKRLSALVPVFVVVLGTPHTCPFC